MKHCYLLFSLCLTALLWTSCSNDILNESSYPPTEKASLRNGDDLLIKEKNIYNTILSYLELKDNQYILHLSKDQAFLAGIPEEEYGAVVKDIQKTNEMIKTNMQEDPDGTINLADPQNLPTSTTFDVQTLASMPGGTINTDGQEEQRSDLFSAPYEANYVRFNCYTNTRPVAGFTCRTYAGKEIRLGTTSSIGGIAPPVDVVLAYSGITCQVGFQTTDDSGGRCAWQCIHK